MSDILGSAFWLLVTLGILVTFHEFGHFWVARRCGVKVLRFSIGFGKPIWSHWGRDGTEYAIAAIPLGGYVKFLDARETDHPELIEGKPGEFSAKPVWQRMLIAAAGPVFNIAFTIFALWAMFVMGRPDYEPVIAAPQGLAAEAGFKAGDRFTAVDGEKVESMSNAMLGVLQGAVLHRDVPITVIDAGGQTVDRVLPLSKLQGDIADNEKVYDSIGLHRRLPAQIGAVTKDSPAARAGITVGDRIVSINGKAIADFDDITAAINAQADANPRLDVAVMRDGAALTLPIAPEKTTIEGVTKWRIGIGPSAGAMNALERYGPLQSVPAALRETWRQARNTFRIVGGMLSGQASTKNLSSVITIAQVANESAHQGLAWFLSFLAMISLSLGILNLLPIPILDGGHLVYYLIEWVKGSPVSERAMAFGQYVGLALLATLMSLAFYNDIVRNLAS